jgi:hypothetical protein
MNSECDLKSGCAMSQVTSNRSKRRQAAPAQLNFWMRVVYGRFTRGSRSFDHFADGPRERQQGVPLHDRQRSAAGGRSCFEAFSWLRPILASYRRTARGDERSCGRWCGRCILRVAALDARIDELRAERDARCSKRLTSFLFRGHPSNSRLSSRALFGARARIDV